MTNEENLKSMPTSALAETLAKLTESYSNDRGTTYSSPYDYSLELEQAEIQWKKWLKEECQ